MDELRPDTNPYSMPHAPLAHPSSGVARPRASRWKRLFAYLLDFAIFVACCLPAGISGDRSADGNPSALATLMTFALFLALLVVDLILLARHGQTLGKRALGIRVVGSDGSRVGLGRVFGLRYVVNNLLGIIPLYALIDVAMIFSDDRRCLHDRMADTIVVDA